MIEDNDYGLAQLRSPSLHKGKLLDQGLTLLLRVLPLPVNVSRPIR
jgi:hypothetical protein